MTPPVEFAVRYGAALWAAWALAWAVLGALLVRRVVRLAAAARGGRPSRPQRALIAAGALAGGALAAFAVDAASERRASLPRALLAPTVDLLEGCGLRDVPDDAVTLLACSPRHRALALDAYDRRLRRRLRRDAARIERLTALDRLRGGTLRLAWDLLGADQAAEARAAALAGGSAEGRGLAARVDTMQGHFREASALYETLSGEAEPHLRAAEPAALAHLLADRPALAERALEGSAARAVLRGGDPGERALTPRVLALLAIERDPERAVRADAVGARILRAFHDDREIDSWSPYLPPALALGARRALRARVAPHRSQEEAVGAARVEALSVLFELDAGHHAQALAMARATADALAPWCGPDAPRSEVGDLCRDLVALPAMVLVSDGRLAEAAAWMRDRRAVFDLRPRGCTATPGPWFGVPYVWAHLDGLDLERPPPAEGSRYDFDEALWAALRRGDARALTPVDPCLPSGWLTPSRVLLLHAVFPRLREGRAAAVRWLRFDVGAPAGSLRSLLRQHTWRATLWRDLGDPARSREHAEAAERLYRALSRRDLAVAVAALDTWGETAP